MITFHGIYHKTIRRNFENGKTLFAIKPTETVEYVNKYGDVTCYASMHPIMKQTPVEIKGEIVQSRRGPYILVQSITETFDDRNALISYLCSDYFKGIGEVTAKALYDAFPGTLNNVLCRDDAFNEIKSKKIPKLNDDKIKILIETAQKTQMVRKTYFFIARLHADLICAEKLIDKYGFSGIDKLKESPYHVGYEIDLPFEICEALAQKTGIIAYEKLRVEALIYEVLRRNEDRGNTKMHAKELIEQVNQLSEKSIYECTIPYLTIWLIVQEMKGIKVDHEYVYQKKTWDAESNIVFHMKRLDQTSKQMFQKIPDLPCEFIPSESQKRAENIVLRSGVKLLIGGPGTGKSTTIKRLLEYYQTSEHELKVSLCAPTGRAAQRITEITGRPAQTIHKLIDYKIIAGEKVCKNQSDPIEADIIIIDEFSMVDVFIFSDLLSAVRSGCTVILCGDEDQLPSVGAGNLLHDIKESNLFETYVLDHVFRQKEESSISQNIQKIRKGQTDLVHDKHFKIYNIPTTESFDHAVKFMIKEYCQKGSQIISMVKKNDYGTQRINHDFQHSLNYDSHEVIEYKHQIFHVNDQIMMIHNNYDLDYFNGDMGIVRKIENETLTIELEGKKEILEITAANLDDVQLSYAITIHKSQGSEYKSGSIIMPAAPSVMLSRNLFLTAVSRFKEDVTIYSQNHSWYTAILNIYKQNRITGLAEKLKKQFA